MKSLLSFRRALTVVVCLTSSTLGCDSTTGAPDARASSTEAGPVDGGNNDGGSNGIDSGLEPLPPGELDYYDGTAGPESSLFEVRIQQGDRSVTPHVYQIDDSNFRGREFSTVRTMSWVDVGQGETDRLRVTVTRLGGEVFPENVHIRPSRYGIAVRRMEGGRSIQFDVVGNEKWVSIHYGEEPLSYEYPANSSKRDAMFVFVTDMPLPVPADVDLEFAAGEHNINNDPTGRGILNPEKTNDYKIYLHRGAWVRGKLDLFDRGEGPSRRLYYGQQILGNGVLSGEAFDWSQRNSDASRDTDGATMIRSFQNGTISGITVVQGSFHQFHTWHNHEVDQVRALGWHNNSDGIQLRGNTTVSDSFFRAGDDTVRIMEDSNITVERTVVWQNHNGGSFVMAHDWGRGLQENILFQECDIIAAENPVFDDRNQAHRTGLGVYKYGNEHMIRNVTFRDIRFDTPQITSAIRVGLYGDATGTMDGVTFENIQIFGRVVSMYVGETASNVQFRNVRIHNSTGAWLLSADNRDELVENFHVGANVTGLMFSE